jgi:hypothetical protein
MRPLILPLMAALLTTGVASADETRQTKNDHYDAFRQLDAELPTPNVYRTASGAPGSRYWQQRADHNIRVILNEDNQSIAASQTIRYTNNSPDTLRYIWIQLDQNRFRADSAARLTETASKASGEEKDREEGQDMLTYSELARQQRFADVDHGFVIQRVADGRGRDLSYTIVDTMMRIDLPQPLGPGERTAFSIDWSFNIIEEAIISGRGGYDHFPETDTYIYFLAQWFPRLAAYTDYVGWQHQQFLGAGEFTLEFGDYEVEITVPADHIVSATGELQNEADVLTAEQRQRLNQARSADKPMYVVTPEEALENEQEGTSGTKTWIFKASNVRDFAWASSRKFIWDAMIHRQDDAAQPEVLAMSFFPNEAEPMWSQYSTHSVVHTMEVYSRFSFPYPYPTAQSVNAWERGGMEYPMITFNGRRPEPFEPDEEDPDPESKPDRTYSRSSKHGLIGVIIHEIGHIYFPMTVNSDERQWTWMDEGINSFLQYLAELEWEENFHNHRDNYNILEHVAEYMTSENQVPIMTHSDSILQFGPNGYTKPASYMHDAGNSNGRRLPICSAHSKTHRVSTSTGSGAAGSTRRTMSTSPSTAFVNTKSRPPIPRSNSNLIARSVPTKCRKRSDRFVIAKRPAKPASSVSRNWPTITTRMILMRSPMLTVTTTRSFSMNWTTGSAMPCYAPPKMMTSFTSSISKTSVAWSRHCRC